MLLITQAFWRGFLVTICLITSCRGPSIEETKEGSKQKNEVTLSATERQARSEGIRTFFGDKLKRRQVVATTVTASGQKIDWIRPESHHQ